MRGSHSKDYTAATRIFGLVDGNLLWRWDVAAGKSQATDGGSGLEAHASAILSKVG